MNVVPIIRPDADFASFMEGVARRLWGEPNKGLSTGCELRWGAHGSRSVDLEKGVWHDHEGGTGGGVLKLLERERGLANGAAMDWLREEGFDVPARDNRALTVQPHRKPVASYDYADEDGEVLFQVVRYEPKDFRQRRPDPAGKDGWNWSIKGVRQIPYRLPEVIEAIANGQPIAIVEGEKDVEALWARGIPATCNAGGAGKWPASFAEHFSGAEVVIIPDNDAAGRNHADVVGSSLSPVADSVRVLLLPDLPPKGDVSDWLAANDAPDALRALMQHGAIPWRVGAPVSRYGAILWSDLANFKPRRDHVVEDIAFPGDLMLTYGESRAGKSFVAIDMALSIARGVPFFGKKTRRGPVVYQAGEGSDGVVSRLLAYGIHYGVRTMDLPFVLLKSRIDLYSTDGDVEPLIEELRAYETWFGERLAMVTIDTFSAATPGANENASEDMSRVISNGKKIKEATGAAVNFVHHKNAGGTKARGHTSLFADADAAIDVIRDEETNQRHFRLAKVKDGEDGKKIGFELHPVEIGSNDDGKIITSCVVLPAQEEDPRTGNRPARLPAAKAKFLMALDDTILHRGGQIPSSERVPHNMRGVEWTTFVSFYRAVSDPHQKDDAIRQALSRDGDWLLGAGLIGRDSPWVWITDKGRAALKW